MRWENDVSSTGDAPAFVFADGGAATRRQREASSGATAENSLRGYARCPCARRTGTPQLSGILAANDTSQRKMDKLKCLSLGSLPR